MEKLKNLHEKNNCTKILPIEDFPEIIRKKIAELGIENIWRCKKNGAIFEVDDEFFCAHENLETQCSIFLKLQMIENASDELAEFMDDFFAAMAIDEIDFAEMIEKYAKNYFDQQIWDGGDDYFFENSEMSKDEKEMAKTETDEIFHHDSKEMHDF